MLNNFTTGGQIFLHNMRMFAQVTRVPIMVALISVVFLSLFITYQTTEPFDRYLAKMYVAAKIQNKIGGDSATVNIMEKLGDEPRITQVSWLLSNSFFMGKVDFVKSQFKRSFYISIGFALLLVILLVWLLNKKGKAKQAPRYISGARLFTPTKLTKMIRTNGGGSSISIGAVPLPKDTEMYNILFMGSPGVGKTQCIHQMIDKIRGAGQKTIIYDIEGSFVKAHYREGQDIIFNPFDERFKGWDVWVDCKNPMQFDVLSKSLIAAPPNGTDPFWSTAARIIFPIAAQRMANDKDRSNTRLLKLLTSMNVDNLVKHVKGSEVEAMVSKDADRMAISIKAMLSNHLSCLKYLTKQGNSFSLRDWVRSPDDSTLFITSRDDVHETLRPLLTAWLDILSNAILSLDEDASRKIWFLVDEMATLNKMPTFEQLLARGRKRGVSVVVGLQTIAQLKENCGVQAAEKISGMFGTRVLFRNKDPDTARWISRSIGETVVEETVRNISFGADSIRDGVTLNQKKSRYMLVPDEKIMTLRDMRAYVSFAGSFPIAQVKIKYRKRSGDVQSFIPIDEALLIDESNETPKLTQPVKIIAEKTTSSASDKSTAQTDSVVQPETVFPKETAVKIEIIPAQPVSVSQSESALSELAAMENDDFVSSPVNKTVPTDVSTTISDQAVNLIVTKNNGGGFSTN